MHSNALFSFKAGPRSVGLLPFLYQTRTLIPFLHQHANQSSFRRAVHQPSEAASPPTKESQASGFKISRVDPIYGQTDREYAEEVASYPTYAEWKQSQLQLHPPSLEGFDQRSHELQKSDIDQYDSAPEVLDEAKDVLNDFGDNNVQKEYDLDSYRPGTPPKESTITESEKEAFNRIFSDIYKKLKVNDGEPGKSQKSASFSDPDKGQARETTTELMNQAVRDAKTGRRRQPLSFKNWQAAEDPLEVDERMRVEIEKYPPSLRPAASRALASVARRDVLDSGTQSAESEEQLGQVNRLEYLREPERKRVEQLMRAAKTDFELWQVMEHEVFSIVSKLGLRYGEEKATAAQSTEENEDGQEAIAPSNDESPNFSQFEVLGPLYPSHLLLGIRFLSSAFSQPSQLALSVLPHVKSLGIISQVLGASTALYNEILRIQWLRYGNYNAIIELLIEMENSGLDFDRETLDIVQGIQRMRDRVSDGERGEVVKALFAARFAPLSKSFSAWERKIRAVVAERGREFERRLTWVQ